MQALHARGHAASGNPGDLRHCVTAAVKVVRVRNGVGITQFGVDSKTLVHLTHHAAGFECADCTRGL